MRYSPFIILLLLTALCPQNAHSQLVAETPRQRVGELVWQNPKTVSFAVRNQGSQPLTITEVHPACGCLSVNYPREPILPGQQSVVEAVFDARLLGTFHKEMAVYTNRQSEPLYLSFEGHVVETPLDYEGDFPIDLGNVRLSTNYVEFDDVSRGDRPSVELQVANVEHGAYTPQLMHLPQYLTAEYLPEQIQPGRVGRIRLTLDSEGLFTDGLNQTSLYLARYLGDKIGEENEIVVSSVLLPAFRDLTAEEMERAPHIVLMDGNEMVEDEATLVLGKKKRATKVFQVTNIGEEMLTISAVQVFNRALTVSLGDRNIAPHGTTKLKITVDAKWLKKAKNEPRLLLISNDPRHAKTVLNLSVE